MTLLKVLLDKRHLPLVKIQHHMRMLVPADSDKNKRDETLKVLFLNSSDEEDDSHVIRRLLSQN